MKGWNRLEENIQQQVVMLRQNRDDIDSAELVRKIVSSIQLFLDCVEDVEENRWLLEECMRRLQDLVDAFSSEDIVFFADVLEFEILDMIRYIVDREDEDITN